MIVQAILDFFRDIVVNWISGISALVSPDAAESAGAAISGVGGSIASLLWLFLDPSVYVVAVGAFGAFLLVVVLTQLVAIIGRRGAAGK